MSYSLATICNRKRLNKVVSKLNKTLIRLLLSTARQVSNAAYKECLYCEIERK